MDVAKYIGLFLLKNEQCYVNGLGTLQLLRKPATYDGEHLQPATYEIALAQGGNVDETLANFIANNEQVSITKASNALKDFSNNARNELQAGNEVSLPHLGKFTMTDGRILFVTAPQLKYKATPIASQKGISLKHNERPAPAAPQQKFVLPTAPVTNVPMGNEGVINNPGIPAMPQVKRYMQQPVNQPQGEKLNWARIIFVLLLLVVLAGATYYGYMRYLAPKKPAQQSAPLSMPETAEEIAEPDTAMADSTDMVADSNGTINQPAGAATPAALPGTPTTPAQQPTVNAAATPAKKMRNVRVALYTTSSKEAADKIRNSIKLKSNRLEVLQEDASSFIIVTHVKTSLNDIATADSVGAVYGAEGAFIY